MDFDEGYITKEFESDNIHTSFENYTKYKNGSFCLYPSFTFLDVSRAFDCTLYMAFYFPQYHISPWNVYDNEYFTDWDFFKFTNRSFTPQMYYNLANENVFDEQDAFAANHSVGVFIFYSYWENNLLRLSYPVDLYDRKKRKTKYMFCFATETNTFYKKSNPEEHAYALLRFFTGENYLTDKNGKKPITVYFTQGGKSVLTYWNRFRTFLLIYGIEIRLGQHFMHYKNSWEELSHDVFDFGCEFGPHNRFKNSGVKGSSLIYNIHKNSFKDYWQGIISYYPNNRCMYKLGCKSKKL